MGQRETRSLVFACGYLTVLLHSFKFMFVNKHRSRAGAVRCLQSIIQISDVNRHAHTEPKVLCVLSAVLPMD